MMVELPVPTGVPETTGVEPCVGTGFVMGGIGFVGGGSGAPGAVLVAGGVITLGVVPGTGVATGGVVGVVEPGVAGDVTAGVVVTTALGVVMKLALDTTTVGPVGFDTSHAVPIRENKISALIRVI
jgi:hypothetical protein